MFQEPTPWLSIPQTSISCQKGFIRFTGCISQQLLRNNQTQTPTQWLKEQSFFLFIAEESRLGVADSWAQLIWAEFGHESESRLLLCDLGGAGVGWSRAPLVLLRTRLRAHGPSYWLQATGQNRSQGQSRGRARDVGPTS